MELETAIEIVNHHQEWGSGNREKMIHEPKKLTEVLDIVLCAVKKLHAYCDVCGSDDIIEAPSMGYNCNSCNPL